MSSTRCRCATATSTSALQISNVSCEARLVLILVISTLDNCNSAWSVSAEISLQCCCFKLLALDRQREWVVSQRHISTLDRQHNALFHWLHWLVVLEVLVSGPITSILLLLSTRWTHSGVVCAASCQLISCILIRRDGRQRTSCCQKRRRWWLQEAWTAR